LKYANNCATKKDDGDDENGNENDGKKMT